MGFALVPIYTRYLTPGDYGILALFSVVVFTIRPIILMGAARFIEVEYFNLKKKNLAELVGYSIVNSLGVFLILFTAFFLLKEKVNDYVFHGEISNDLWIVLVPLVAFGFAINSIGSIVFRNSENSSGFFLMSFGRSVLEHSVGLVLIISFYFAWQGKVLGMVIAAVFSFVALIIYLFKTGRLSFNQNYFKKSKTLYNSALPLLIMDITILGIESSDRIFISVMTEEGTAAVGIYSVAYLIGGAVIYIVNAFTNIFSPEVFKLLRENSADSRERIVKQTTVFFLAVLAFSLVISLTKEVIFNYFIGPQFYQGVELVSIIAFSFVFQVMFLLGYNICMFKGRSKIPSRISMVAFLLNAILNFVLIKYMGVKGAAVSTFFTYAFMGCTTLFISQLLVKLPWLSAFTRIK